MKSVLVASAALGLAACGGASSDVSNPPPADNSPFYSIQSFDVFGTSDDEAGRAPIDPQVSNGNFVLSLEIKDGNTSYGIRGFVSQNQTLSDSDVDFLQVSCNPVDCGSSGTVSDDCFFGSDNSLFCTRDDDGFVADLTPFLDTIPKDAHIIIQSCDPSFTTCETASHPVQFR